TSAASPGWVGSLRPRLGYAMGPLMIYGTGGLAYGNPALMTFNSNFRLGWTAGAGVEYQLYKNMGLRLEYLHTDLGPSTNTADHFTDTVVRLALNFPFSFVSGASVGPSRPRRGVRPPSAAVPRGSASAPTALPPRSCGPVRGRRSRLGRNTHKGRASLLWRP